VVSILHWHNHTHVDKIAGVAPNSTALIVGRAIAGLGGAGIASGAYTIIAFSAKPHLRAAFTGLLGAAYGIASVVGPLLGGVFAEKATWRWCFYINLPIGGIAAGIILLFFTTPPQAVPVQAALKEKILQMDLPGTFTVMAAVICYILALQWGGQSKAWSSSDVIGTLIGFGLLTILFLVIEYYQGERAIIIGRLLKDRTVAVGCAFISFLGGGFFLLLYYIPIYFQVVSGVTASQSGVRNLPLILGTSIATIISGGLISAYGHFVPFLILGAVGSTIGSGLLYSLSTTSGHSMWIGYQALAGLGIGLCLQIPVISAQAVVAPGDLSSVTAMILCQFLHPSYLLYS
jgi:MFS family permease